MVSALISIMMRDSVCIAIYLTRSQKRTYASDSKKNAMVIAVNKTSCKASSMLGASEQSCLIRRSSFGRRSASAFATLGALLPQHRADILVLRSGCGVQQCKSRCRDEPSPLVLIQLAPFGLRAGSAAKVARQCRVIVVKQFRKTFNSFQLQRHLLYCLASARDTACTVAARRATFALGVTSSILTVLILAPGLPRAATLPLSARGL